MDDDEFFECQESFSSEATSKIPDRSEKSSKKDQITDDSGSLYTDISNINGDKTVNLDLNTESIIDDVIEIAKNDGNIVVEEELSEQEKEELLKDSLELKSEGNLKYKEKNYQEACDLYSEGIRICPKSYSKEVSVLFANRCAAYMAMDKAKEALSDCNEAINLDPCYVKVLLRRAQLLEDKEKFEESLKDYQKVVEIDPSCCKARAACMRLPKQIEEKNEKMKEEMFGQMKKLGNMVLKPFGLSTNNFQMQQNEGGSYNIQFVQNPSTNS